MINTGQPGSKLPVVGWQGEKTKPYKLFRLEDSERLPLSLTNESLPSDGHDPRTPHRIGFHAMMLVTHGGFDHWLDFKTYCFSRNHLIYVAPNQIHHFMNRKRTHKVWILIFRPEVLPSGLLPVDTKLTPWPIMSYRWPSVTKIKPAETRLLAQQMEFLCNLELNYPDSFFPAAKHHACGIIALGFELAMKHHNSAIDCQSNSRFFEFVQLVEEWFKSRRDVKWYSEKMDCSQRTLNRCCQRATGQSAKSVLTQRVVVEAKRLLTYSDTTISSVATEFGFSATTNFVRYFRNETGMTPQEFRSANHLQ